VPLHLNLKRRLGYYSLKRWYTFHFRRRWPEPVIAVCSIAKSGTTYFRLVFANYVQLVYGDPDQRIDYAELSQRFFPNRILSSMRPDLEYEPAPPGHVIRRAGYEDFLWDHSWEYAHLLGRGSRVVHLYRNPLDALVSQYFYFWENRPEKERIHKEVPGSPIRDPFSFLPYFLPEYSRHYRRLRHLARSKSNVLRVPYEKLIGDPIPTYADTLRWLGLDVDSSAVEEAVARSGKKAVRAEEAETGNAIHAWPGFKGSFIRSGRIGEWREYLSDSQVEEIRRELAGRDISLDEFQLVE